jgi:pimeloyl-ACP methyl ester carboxylesterase
MARSVAAPRNGWRRQSSARDVVRARSAFASRKPRGHGASAFCAAGPPLALARVAVADLAATRARLGAGGAPFRQRGGALVVGAGEAMGAALAFEAGERR